MGFTRLSSWQVLLALALTWALIAWLHRERRAVRRVVVPLLSLWDELAPPRSLARLRSRVRRSLLLGAALAFGLLLTLAAADPRPPWLAAIGPARTRLIMIDVGRSMQATDVAPTRFARALDLARAIVSARPGRTELSIAQLDAGVTPLSGPSDDAEVLRAAIARARPSAQATRFDAAAAFALAQLRGRLRPELILISDGASDAAAAALAPLSAAGIPLRQIRLGSSSRNVGIRAFSVRAEAWDAERCEVMLDLQNADAVAHRVELTLLEDGEAIDLHRLELPAHGQLRQFYPLTASGQRIEAQLAIVDGGGAARARDADDLPLDDAAYAVLAQRPARRVLVVSAGDRYLDAALALDPRASVQRVKPSDYRSAQGHDVVIFDRFAPPDPPGIPALYLAPPATPSDQPLRITGTIRRPFVDRIERDHPLLRLVALRDVNIGEAQRVQLEPGDRAIASSRLGPLIVSGQRAGAPFIALAFDLRQSDLPLRVAWPMLLARSLDQLSPLPLGGAIPFEVGSATVATTEPAGGRLVGPDGQARPVHLSMGEVRLELERPGFYALETAAGSQLLAVGLEPAPSLSIAPRRLAPEPASPESTGAATRLAPGREPGLWLLAAGLLTLALYWLLHARSVPR